MGSACGDRAPHSTALESNVGGPPSGLTDPPGGDHTFIERPNIWDTWAPSKQQFWDFLADRFRGRCTPHTYLNISELAREYECSRTWVQDCLRFFRCCNLLELYEENEHSPNEYRIHWDFRERSFRDLPFLFEGGCNKFSPLSSHAESSIRDESGRDCLTDSQRHRLMKYVRINFSDRAGSVLTAVMGRLIWKQGASVSLIEYLLGEIAVVHHSLKDRIEDSFGEWAFGLCQKWLNNLRTRYQNMVRKRQERQEKREKHRKEASGGCPQHLVDKLQQNDVVAA